MDHQLVFRRRGQRLISWWSRPLIPWHDVYADSEVVLWAWIGLMYMNVASQRLDWSWPRRRSALLPHNRNSDSNGYPSTAVQ